MHKGGGVVPPLYVLMGNTQVFHKEVCCSGSMLACIIRRVANTTVDSSLDKQTL